MTPALEIRVYDLDRSVAVIRRSQSMARRLCRVFPAVSHCDIRVERAAAAASAADAYTVSVHVGLADALPDADQQVLAQAEAEDALVAIRNAFDVLRRKIAARTRRYQQRTRRSAPHPSRPYAPATMTGSPGGASLGATAG